MLLIDRANVLPSMAFFREVFDEVAARYPDVETERFDVMVTESVFGDFLSDLAAGTVGGMGMAPSADIGER